MNLNLLKKYPFPLLSSIFLTAIPLIFSSVITFWVVHHEAQINQFSFTKWLILTIFCCITSTFAFTPPTFLALVLGYFLGWNAILPLFIINMVAIYLINILVNRLNKDELTTYISENSKAQNILNGLHKEELKLIFFTKLSPVIPFALMNLVFALSGAKLKNILWGGFLGMIPRTILAIWTGMEAKQISILLANPNEGNISKIILIVLIISSIVGVFLVVNKAIKKREL